MARPAKFTLAEIRREALALVDRDGLAGLTMRGLAAALKTGPMTLYNYVDGKESLEELVVDAVASEVPPVAVTSDWAADLTAAATGLWATVRLHPAVIPLVLTRRTSTSASLRPAEDIASALARSGRTGFDLLVAFRAVMGFVMGIAQAELAGPLTSHIDPRQEATDLASIAGEANPTLAQLSQLAGEDARREFDEGLRILVLGLARQRAPEGGSPENRTQG